MSKLCNAVTIHDTAEVDSTAVIGAGTRIWNQVHIREQVSIGDHCVIGSSVWLTESVPAGTRVVMEKPKLRIRGQLPAGDPDYLDFQI